jgi:hypothetical protein
MDTPNRPPDGEERAPSSSPEGLSPPVHLDLGFAAGPTTPNRGGPPAVRRALFVAVAVILLVGIAAVGVKFFGLRGTRDLASRMVPANTDVYATIYLDPSLNQKMHVRDLLRKFPALNTDTGLNHRLDQFLEQALSETGLSFTKDVRPWLGTQVAVASRASASGVLIASNDDVTATRLLGRIRNTPQGRELTWAEHAHGGLTVSVGTPESDFGRPVVYSYVDHTAVIGNDERLVDAIIDTSQGVGRSLESSESYRRAIAPLPAERLGTIYVNLVPVLRNLKEALELSPFRAGLSTGLDQIDALSGLGVSMSAQANGLAADINITLNRSRLTANTRDFLETGEHRNAALDWLPDDTYGFVAGNGTRRGLEQAILEATGSDAEAARAVHDLGVVGPQGVISHLTGDMVIEVGPGAGQLPDGAVLVGTHDAAGMQRFLDKLARLATEEFRGFGDSRVRIEWQRETYRGVTIASLPLHDLGPGGPSPAYAVFDGMAILASSPEEIKELMAVHAGGTSISSSPNFRDAAAEANLNNDGMIFVDMEAVVGAIRGVLPPEFNQEFDREAGPNLAPIKSFIFTAQHRSDRLTARIFVVIR